MKLMLARNILLTFAALPVLLASVLARAQDVPGIEICTVEKTMERRTSCLQSNVEFLHKTITKASVDHQQKLDAANRQIEALKATVASLQKMLDDLQAARKKELDGQNNALTPAPAEAASAKKSRE